MTLTHIAAFGAAGMLYLLLCPQRWRGWLLLVVSVVALYWLQSALPIRRLDFALPGLTLALSIGLWAATQKKPWQRQDYIALGLVAGMVLGLGLTRYLIPELRPTPSRPPTLVVVLLGLGSGLAFISWLAWLRPWGRYTVLGGQALILLLFIVLKTEALTTELSAQLRALASQDISLANPADLQWLGFSYVAFRLLHLLRDWQLGTLPALSLREHLTYVIFFPAITAGPIDRAERFVEDDRALGNMIGWEASRLTEAGGRIAVGIFKKFIVADTLALVALNSTNAEQTTSAAGTWLLLYLFALRLYFDFSGYSDIAIGLALLFGIRLPENFDRPYLKQSITAFWQSWHMTLSNWVRFYVFSPLSRSLLRRKPKPSPRMIVFITQMTTMLVIGLWHGVTLNFILWGLWHGLGLFAHKVWSDSTRGWYMGLESQPRLKQAWTGLGVLLTFHYVALGWVWFSLSDFEQASQTWLKLWGLG
jgi:D-alanyl-lipoteichoic acid acyltransferase DltB (MBOAT superfamily)